MVEPGGLKERINRDQGLSAKPISQEKAQLSKEGESYNKKGEERYTGEKVHVGETFFYTLSRKRQIENLKMGKRNGK